MLSDVKRVSGLPKKGVVLVSLNLFGNQWDQSDAACDDWAELCGAGSFFGLCWVTAVWGWGRCPAS